MNFLKRACYLSAGVTFLLIAAIPAHAQLALSYNLEVGSSRIEQPAVPVSPCAGFNWLASIGACSRELFMRISPGPRPEDMAIFEPAPVSGSSDLSEAGRPERDPRLLRSAGGKAADLLLRFGSKLRQRNADESSSEWSRFSDTTYDSYVKSNGHKALGVELLVPFQ